MYAFIPYLNFIYEGKQRDFCGDSFYKLFWSVQHGWLQRHLPWQVYYTEEFLWYLLVNYSFLVLPAFARLVPSLVSKTGPNVSSDVNPPSSLSGILKCCAVLCVQKQCLDAWLLCMAMAGSFLADVSGMKPGSLQIFFPSLCLTWFSTNTDGWFQEWMELLEVRMGLTGRWDFSAS